MFYVFVKVFRELGKLLGEIVKELEVTFMERLDVRRFDNQYCFERVFMQACCVVVTDAFEGWRLKNLSLCLKTIKSVTRTGRQFQRHCGGGRCNFKGVMVMLSAQIRFKI